MSQGVMPAAGCIRVQNNRQRRTPFPPFPTHPSVSLPLPPNTNTPCRRSRTSAAAPGTAPPPRPPPPRARPPRGARTRAPPRGNPALPTARARRTRRTRRGRRRVARRRAVGCPATRPRAPVRAQSRCAPAAAAAGAAAAASPPLLLSPTPSLLRRRRRGSGRAGCRRSSPSCMPLRAPAPRRRPRRTRSKRGTRRGRRCRRSPLRRRWRAAQRSARSAQRAVAVRRTALQQGLWSMRCCVCYRGSMATDLVGVLVRGGCGRGSYMRRANLV